MWFVKFKSQHIWVFQDWKNIYFEQLVIEVVIKTQNVYCSRHRCAKGSSIFLNRQNSNITTTWIRYSEYDLSIILWVWGSHINTRHSVVCWYRGYVIVSDQRGAAQLQIPRIYGVNTSYPGNTKHLYLHLYNVGPASKMLGRRCINVIQMVCVYWVCSSFLAQTEGRERYNRIIRTKK